jgi:hypothetical protein
LLAPPLYHRRDALRDVDVVPPLFVRWRVRDDGSTGLIAGPLVSASDPEGTTTALLPLYFRFYDRRADAATHLFFPVAGFHHRPGARGAFVGPVYGWSSAADGRGGGGWGAGLFPIALFGRSGPRHHALLLPLFGHVSNDTTGSSTTVVGPVFHRRQPNGRGWDGGLFPLVFAGRRGDRTYGGVPGLFWHVGDKHSETDVVGPIYGHRDTHGWGFGLAPLLFFGREEARAHQVIFPILFRFTDGAKRTERTLVGPFFHRRDGDETADVLFPLMYLRKSPRAGLLVTPLAGWKRDPRGTETVVVGPYVHTTNRRTHSSTHLLFPIGVVHRSPGYDVTAQFPLFWRVRQGNETDTVVFPLYWRMRAPGTAVDGLFPIFLRARTQVATTTVFGPFWHRARADGGRSGGLFPLLAYGKSYKDGHASRWLGLPGVYWAKNDRAGASDLIVGPFFDIGRDYGYTAGLPPLVFAWRRGTASKVLLPFYYRQWDRAADSAFNVFTLLYWGHAGKARSFGLAPIFFAKTHGDGTYSATLLPLFHFKKKTVGSTLLTPLFGYSTSAIGTRAYAATFYVRRDRDVSSTALWPLFYRSVDRATESSTTLALPILFDRRAEDGRELQAYTPLTWRYHSVEGSTVVGVPLFFDVHRYGESRTTSLLPFFIRNTSKVTNSTWWTFPPLLAWGRTRRGGDDAGTDAVLFPLFWHFGGKNHSTVLPPLVWDFRRGTSRTTVVIPFGAHWKRSDSDHTLALNLYYKRGRGPREGSWYVNIYPMTSFGRPRKQDLQWSLFEGLIGYSREGRNRTLHLLFFLDIPLEPAPRSASASFFGSTPTSARTDLF